MPTMQETFDQAVLGVLEQGGPSLRAAINGKMDCAYRGEDGRKCAAGHLIPDSWYRAGMESIVAKSDTPAGMALLQLGHSLSLVHRLQAAHDDAALLPSRRVTDNEFLARFCAEVHELASKENLSMEAVQQHRNWRR